MLTVKDKPRHAFAISESFAPLRALAFAQSAGYPTAANGAKTLKREEGGKKQKTFRIQCGSWGKWLIKVSW